MIDFGKHITECQEDLKVVEGEGLLFVLVNDPNDPIIGCDEPCWVLLGMTGHQGTLRLGLSSPWNREGYSAGRISELEGWIENMCHIPSWA